MGIFTGRRIYHHRDHADYSLVDHNCGCGICIDWRETKGTYEAATARVVSHDRSCSCADCGAMRKLRTAYFAANNRRDLYCEISYLVTYSRDLKPYEDRAMKWLSNEIAAPGRSDGWWEGRAPYYSLGYWLNKFIYAASNAVSGVGSSALAVSGVA